MATGILAILDDVVTLLDDAAAMSKVAAKKTAGVLGDDLAVNAEKASGFAQARELSVIWAIAKGSLLNKLIILPVAFVMSAYTPWLIIPILMLGGLYLAFEGAEKVYEFFIPHAHHLSSMEVGASEEEMLEIEAKKIKSAILTDFILSIEIVIIALASVADQTLGVQILVVSFIALLATVGVYGIVAMLVRMDDLGLRLIAVADEGSYGLKWLGNTLVTLLPKVIKALMFIGTLAMFLVAGGIFVHHIEWLHHLLPGWLWVLGDLMVGFVIGVLVLGAKKGVAGAIRQFG
jgi:uncharacterized protein